MRDKLSAYAGRPWISDLLLLLTSFCIYFYYFPGVFLSPNSVLSSINGDALKNYYTYLYHIKNDQGFVHFAGMNYPYGEHVAYTDSHPFLTLILHYLPFTHRYLIGILHVLIFGSYILTPLIISRVLHRLGLDRSSGFFISMGLTLLSPQFFRIYAGHYSMSYPLIIPLSVLLLLNYFRSPSWKWAWLLFLFHIINVFVHMYPAFGLCVFAATAIVLSWVFGEKRSSFLKTSVHLFVAALLPLLLFKLFLVTTDHHLQRPALPYGFEASVTTFGSLLVPYFGGPFAALLSGIFKTAPGAFEGYCYLGFGLILLTVLVVALLPFVYRKINFNKELLALLIASFLLLLFAFGAHLPLTGKTNETLNQFRALGRYSWFFYYMLPFFVFVTLYHTLKQMAPGKKAGIIFGLLSTLFFIANLAEVNTLFYTYRGYFHFRNFFNEQLLNSEEQCLIAAMKQQPLQAIIPLPTYNVGSEIYDRSVTPYMDASLLLSTLYSYHTGLPIVSAQLSRNPIAETEQVISILNTYQKDRPVLALLNQKPFAILKSRSPLMPDEDRLLKHTRMLAKGDSLELRILPASALYAPIVDKNILTVKGAKSLDSSGVIYIPYEARTPFLRSSSTNYERLFRLDSNTFASGRYILSLHYYHTNSSWRQMLCHFLLTKNKDGASQWDQFISMRLLSGFYKGYSVFEHYLDLDAENSYEFFMKNDEAISYRISDVMLRPARTSVRSIRGRDTSWNNFPVKD